MSDADALLAAILADPADDLSRLMLADAIELEQPERAEFIRVQVELARLGGRPYCAHTAEDLPCKGCQYDALRRRERELWNQLKIDGWTCGVFPVAGMWWPDKKRDPDVTGVFRRGFVEAVSCTLEAFAGGPCRRCGLQRVLNPNLSRPRDVSDCKPCSGTGRTPGVAPALFASQPVERVTLTDMAVASDGPGYWVFPDRGDAPDAIQQVLERTHPTLAAALAALSAAAVSLGRTAAGLPPLKPAAEGDVK